MTAPYVKIDPEGILIRMRVEVSQWHIVDAERVVTRCGLFLSHGNEPRPFRDARRPPLRDLCQSVRRGSCGQACPLNGDVPSAMLGGITASGDVG